MISPRLRFQMFLTMKKLEKDHFDMNPASLVSGDDLILLSDTPLKQKALIALADLKVIRLSYTDNHMSSISRMQGSTLYLLARSEIWMNRIGGFAVGIMSALIVEHFISLLF